MSWKTLTVLAVLAACLGGFLVVDSYWLTPKRDKAAGVKGRLWTIEPQDVLALTIKRKDDTVKLKRVGDGWEMLEPVKTRANGGVVNETVTALATTMVPRQDPAAADRLDGTAPSPRCSGRCRRAWRRA